MKATQSCNDQLWDASSLRQLVLTDFRNYSFIRLELNARPVLITGLNGAGKTNLLEAVSFLSHGRGLRNSKLDEPDRWHDSRQHHWGVAATLCSGAEETRIGTGHEAGIGDIASKRVIKLDGERIKSQAMLSNITSIMWLTPQMDGLFLDSASTRRKFFDRLVGVFDSDHPSRLYAYEHHVRERMRLLQDFSDPNWLNVVERKMAERAVAIAAARLEMVERLQHYIELAPTCFPKCTITITGWVERQLEQGLPAREVEDMLVTSLQRYREEDRLSKRTTLGVHRSDFLVIYSEKQMPAAQCSTGEQKALLLSIIMAEARAKTERKAIAPIILLDEVVAHLDASRRQYLYDEMLALKAQVWMTGTDISSFYDIKPEVQHLHVEEGSVATL